MNQQLLSKIIENPEEGYIILELKDANPMVVRIPGTSFTIDSTVNNLVITSDSVSLPFLPPEQAQKSPPFKMVKYIPCEDVIAISVYTENKIIKPGIIKSLNP